MIQKKKKKKKKKKKPGIIVKDFSNLIYIIAFATGWYICHYTHIG